MSNKYGRIPLISIWIGRFSNIQSCWSSGMILAWVREVTGAIPAQALKIYFVKASKQTNEAGLVYLWNISHKYSSIIFYSFACVCTVTCQKYKYNFTLFKVYHVISGKCYTLYSKNSLFSTLDIVVIKSWVVLKGNYMHWNHVRLKNFQ